MKKIILTVLLTSAFAVFAQQATLDPTFTVGTGPDYSVTNIKQLADGKILIAGDFSNYNGNEANRIARLNADGSYDATFTTSLSGPVEALLVDTDGEFLVTEQYGGLKRFNADGSADATFNRPALGGYGPYRVAKQGDKYIVAGDFTIYSPAGVLYSDIARLNHDGTLDTTFAGAELFGNSFVQILVQPDNKIILAGNFTHYNINAVPNIIRLTENGVLDTTFNAGAGAAGIIQAVAMQPDGKYIISGGFESVNGVAKHLNARLNNDGSVDSAFNYTTTVGLPEDGVIAYDIFIQNNGKILLGGSFRDAMIDIEGTPDGSVPVFLTLLNADGSTDDTFTAPFNQTVFALDIQTDGKVLVGGTFTQYDGAPQKSLARLDHNALAVNNYAQSVFMVYPNPVSGKLTINAENLNLANATITITNVLGKQMYNAVHSTTNLQVDMAGYANGIYFVKLQANGKVFTQKIIKN